MPYSGKPLKYRLSYHRSLRVKGEYRLIYIVDENESTVTLVAFGHMNAIYGLMLFSFEGNPGEEIEKSLCLRPRFINHDAVPITIFPKECA